MPFIVFNDVYKTYDNGFRALRGINFLIEKGEFFVIVGPSGCGKSTLLRLMAGLEPLTSGEIHLDGSIINEQPPGLRNLSMVFQNYALFPHMTVYNNIAFGLKIRKVPKKQINKNVIETAELLGLSNYLQKRPRELSGGQRQRVALGRAIIRNPSAFLFDEPLSNLDTGLRSDMRSELLRLHKRLGATALYVTHDQIEAMTLGTRICILKEGEIQQIDSPDNIYHKPVNTFVASFIGSPPMNIINGVVEKHDSDISLNTKSLGTIKIPGAPAAQYTGKNIFAGIMPGHLQVNRTTKIISSLKSIIEIVERIGEDVRLHIKSDSQRLIAATSDRKSYNPGDSCEIKINPERLHLFNPDGIAIYHPEY